MLRLKMEHAEEEFRTGGERHEKHDDEAGGIDTAKGR